MSYKISDLVAARMIQIFQEAVIFGVDGADLMRQVRLVEDTVEPDTLTLDPAYAETVAKMHAKYIAEAETKSAEKISMSGVSN